MRTIKLLVQCHENRKKIVEGLAHEGYKTWVEEKEYDRMPTKTNFYVCFECPD